MQHHIIMMDGRQRVTCTEKQSIASWLLISKHFGFTLFVEISNFLINSGSFLPFGLYVTKMKLNIFALVFYIFNSSKSHEMVVCSNRTQLLLHVVGLLLFTVKTGNFSSLCNRLKNSQCCSSSSRDPRSLMSFNFFQFRRFSLTQ